ncbi:hypothetical protein [Lacticaseibacillus sp. GG6-2]
MQAAELEALIRRVTEEVLAAQRQLPRMLIVDTPDTHAAWHSRYHAALAQAYQLTWVTTGQTGAKTALDQALTRIVPADKLVVSGLSPWQQAQAALGISTDEMTRCLGYAFANGLSVYAPDADLNGVLRAATQPYAAMLADYHRRLQTFGLKVVTWPQLLPQHGKQVITADSVATMPANSTIRVAADAVVTASAKERLRAKNSRLMYTTQGGE